MSARNENDSFNVVVVMVDVMNPIEEIEANFDHVLIVANCHSQIRTNEQYTELAISIVFQLFAADFYCFFFLFALSRL